MADKNKKPDPIKKKKIQSKYRDNSYTPEKSISVFGATLHIPSIENNKEKRDYISRLRKGKRNEIHNAQSRDQKRKIKTKYSAEIKKARGGKTWIGEKISDTKEFIDDVKILKSEVENTKVGRVVRQASDIVSAVASANPERIVREGVDTYNNVKNFNKKKSDSKTKSQDGCVCK